MSGVEHKLSEARPARPAKRLASVIFIVALGFGAIFYKVLLDAKQATWIRAGEVAASVASTMTSEIARNIESYDLSLKAVMEGLTFPEIVAVSPELRQRVLFDRSSAAKHLQGILYLDERGIVRLDSRSAFPRPVSHAARDYFEHHQKHRNTGLFVSRPFFEDSAHVLSLSRRVSNPDGTFAGVVVGMIRLAYFAELFAAAATGPNENVSLFRTDGVMLMRWPYDEGVIGRDMRHAALFEHLAKEPFGRFESYGAADGIYRLYAYRQIGGLPLVVSVGQATDDVYRGWRRYAAIVGLMVVVLCAVCATFAFYLMREMRRRNEAERTLARLAATDPLTGLYNRRDFNASLEREWRRAYREGAPLAMLMIDADYFKSYNDRHGHQGGDTLLKVIGEAMLRSIRRGTDVAARFGGDEFTMLLPGTSTQGAAQVAEAVRKNLAELCADFSIERASLSIGLASLTPKKDQTPAVLIAAADKALYRAKALGRGRVEMAPEEGQEPALNAA